MKRLYNKKKFDLPYFGASVRLLAPSIVRLLESWQGRVTLRIIRCERSKLITFLRWDINNENLSAYLTLKTLLTHFLNEFWHVSTSYLSNEMNNNCVSELTLKTVLSQQYCRKNFQVVLMAIKTTFHSHSQNVRSGPVQNISNMSKSIWTCPK